MTTGDLVVVIAQYRGGAVTFTVSGTGGQTWTVLTPVVTTNQCASLIWCRYNGTWSADPTFRTAVGTNPLTCIMHVFRPSVTTKLWTVDVAQSEVDFAAAATITITGQTPNVADTVSFAGWMTADDNTWGTLSGTNWAVSGTAQYRNTSGSDQSSSYAHIIQYTAAATGNVSKTQLTLGNDEGTSVIITFKEYDAPAAGPGWGGLSQVSETGWCLDDLFRRHQVG